MNTIDYEERPLPSKDFDVTEIVWNVLTAFTLFATVVAVFFFLRIFLNPNSAYNPFPPPTMPALLTIPTATATPRRLPATWTPTATLLPVATRTLRPSSTLPPSATAFSLVTPSSSPTPDATKISKGMPFVIQKGNPIAIANIYHENLGCNWMGVGGQVFDLKNSALRGQQIQLGGILAGTPIPEGYPTLTGLLPYAPGYYEFTLAEHPVASKAKLWVQLVDQAGLPMSEKIYFDTFEDCEKNLIIINFKQVR